MNYAVPPRAPITVPIANSDDFFPINRIYCIARNYAPQPQIAGSATGREAPFFFAKDADGYVPDGSIIPYPPHSRSVFHEVELVVAIGKAGFRVSAQNARDLIFGYAVGFDMTRRDLQQAAHAQGHPWCTGKNYPGAAPLGSIHSIEDVGQLRAGSISLTVNGITKQSSDLNCLIWSVDETIELLSQYYRLLPGDLIFTGTPAGIGPVEPGDILEGSVAGLGTLHITIGDPET